MDMFSGWESRLPLCKHGEFQISQLSELPNFEFSFQPLGTMALTTSQPFSSTPMSHAFNITTSPSSYTTDDNVTIVPDVFDLSTSIENITEASNRTISSAAKDSLAHALYYVYLGPAICVFGMLCNILNLCVLSQKELSESPYTYLNALAVADFGMLAMSFTHLVTLKADHTFAKAIFNTYFYFGLGNICFNCSVWFIVLLTIERMLFVVRPLLTRSSRKRAWIRIVIVIVCSCLLNTPRFFIYEVREYRNTGMFFSFGTEFQKSQTFYGTSWFHAVMINFIPLIILIVANSVLIYAVHRARKQREEFQMNSNQEQSWRKDEARLTKTLISVVVLFIVCTLPSAFVEDPISYAFFSGDKTWAEYLMSAGNQTFIYISNILLFLNCSLNFTLYCAFNDKFRRAMRHFFGKFRFGRKSTRMTFSTGSHSNSSGSSKSHKTIMTHA